MGQLTAVRCEGPDDSPDINELGTILNGFGRTAGLHGLRWTFCTNMSVGIVSELRTIHFSGGSTWCTIRRAHVGVSACRRRHLLWWIMAGRKLSCVTDGRSW